MTDWMDSPTHLLTRGCSFSCGRFLVRPPPPPVVLVELRGTGMPLMVCVLACLVGLGCVRWRRERVVGVGVKRRKRCGAVSEWSLWVEVVRTSTKLERWAKRALTGSSTGRLEKKEEKGVRVCFALAVSHFILSSLLACARRGPTKNVLQAAHACTHKKLPTHTQAAPLYALFIASFSTPTHPFPPLPPLFSFLPPTQKAQQKHTALSPSQK